MPRLRPVSTAPTDPFGLIRLDAAVEAGASPDAIYRDARAGRLERAHRGVYRRPEVVDAHAALRAAIAHLGPTAIGVVHSAARTHGLAGAWDRSAVAVAVPRGLEKRQRAGIDLHFWRIPDVDVVSVDGLPVTSVARTLADTSRLLSRFEAVALVDSALHQGLIVPAQFDQVAAMMGRRPRCPRGRAVLRAARIGAQSPLETRVRLRAADGGFPPDALQVPIRADDGHLVGYADMGYRLPGGGWLYVEADGLAVHELPEAVLHDRSRQNAIVTKPGTHLVRVTWADTTDAATIPGLLRPTLQRVGWHPTGPTHPLWC